MDLASSGEEPALVIADNPDIVDAGYATRRRRAIRSAYAGFFIDSFDIFLPTVALLPAMIYFTQGLGTEATRLVTDFTFAATLLGRPVGAIIFGHFSDRLGRKLTGSISIWGFAITTFVIACLPGTQQIGAVAAITILIALRFIDGVFLGGEYTAATPMAIEYTKSERRGILGGAIQSSATTGYVFIAIFTYVALRVAPVGTNDIHAGFVQWGWRIPFFIGAFLGFGVAWFIRRHVEDSVVWESAERSKAPLTELFSGRKQRLAFLQVFVVMTGIFFGSNMESSLMPQLLLAHKGFSATDETLILIFCNLPVPLSYVLGGWLADRIGRKPAIIIAGCAMTIVMVPALALIGSNSYDNFGLLTLTAFFVAWPSVIAFGIMPAYINERFPTHSRSSGWGIGYSSAVVIPGLFVFYQTDLLSWMPYSYTPAVLAGFGGILVIIGGLIAKETRGTDLSTVDLDEPVAPSRQEAPVRRNPGTSGGAVPAAT